MNPLHVRAKSEQPRQLRNLEILFVFLLALSSLAVAQQWIPITTAVPFNSGTALQLTDGTIMVQQIGSAHWWKLTPDINGFYRTGTWTKLASFPASMNYGPLYYASAVLPDGRVIVEGGEYNHGVAVNTNLGAIYDPVADTWTQVPAPTGWKLIGDAQSVVLPDGTFMMGHKINKGLALLDEAALTWTILLDATKFDENNEEGWTLLPNGNVLAVDAYICVPSCYDAAGTNSEIYSPVTQTWTSAGSTVVQLWDSKAACGGAKKASHEIGPAVLRPDGTVFATGANTCGAAGHTAIYDSATGIWTAAQDLPGVNDMADASASILPDGNVLVESNPGFGNSPITFYEFAFDGSGWLTIPQPIGITGNSEGGRIVATADGTILLSQAGSSPYVWFYLPAGTYQEAWRPTITAAPSSVTVGSSYTISGTQFNGLSQGAYFGDDAQSATNFPIVRLQNNTTKHYFFARTHNFSTMAVATGSAIVSTEFDVLPGTETGFGTLTVIANGIPSKGITVNVLP